MGIKKFFRGTVLYLLGTSLFFLLFILAYSLVFTQVTANPAKIKRILSDSGIYQKIPAVIYDDSVDSDSAGSATIPLKDSAVRQAALDTFTPALVQKNVENVIDGTYGWLDGRTSQPEFSIELKDLKNQFAKSLSIQAGKRLERLPRCTAAQERKIKELEPFSSPCLPAGTNIAAVKKQVLASAANNDNFLEKTKISPDTLKDDSGKSVFADYSELPKAYRLFLKLPYITAAICILLAAGIVFVSSTRREGLKKLALLLAAGGILVIFVPVGISRLTENALKSAPGDRISTELVAPVINELSKTTSKVYFGAGTVYILLAAGAFVLMRRITPPPAKKKQEKPA